MESVDRNGNVGLEQTAQTGHSSGPWVGDEFGNIRDADGYKVAIVCGVNSNDSDIALVAAAPTMLAALEGLVHSMEPLLEKPGYSLEPFDNASLDKAYLEAKEAIKETGSIPWSKPPG